MIGNKIPAVLLFLDHYGLIVQTEYFVLKLVRLDWSTCLSEIQSKQSSFVIFFGRKLRRQSWA